MRDTSRTLTIQGAEVAPVALKDFSRSEELEGDCEEDADRDIDNPLVAAQIGQDAEPTWKAGIPAWASTFTPAMSAKEKESALENLLDAAMSAYMADQVAGRNQLWEALQLLGAYRSQAYKQASLRALGWEEDLAQDFVAHVWEALLEGSYKGTGKFCHWAKVVYRNFANTQLSKVTEERSLFEGLVRQASSADEPAEKGYEQGYIHTDGISMPLLLAERRQESSVERALMGLPETDRLYAEFYKLGMDQKDAAKAMGESVYLARKRERRIGAAFHAAGFGYPKVSA